MQLLSAQLPLDALVLREVVVVKGGSMYVRCDGLYVFGLQIEPCEEVAAYRVVGDDGAIPRFFCPHHYAHFVASQVVPYKANSAFDALPDESEKPNARSDEHSG